MIRQYRKPPLLYQVLRQIADAVSGNQDRYPSLMASPQYLLIYRRSQVLP